ncbi:MAG TPA: PH domain-containing protein [Nitrososphaeraceae archaeon]|nr:PH domain-containing protein [Nitrososphaeraceae archaeon]
MPPFGFSRKEQSQQPFITDITDGEDLEEIKKICHMLNPNEEVFVVARQSRFKPGGSKFTPNIVFGTDRRIIIKDPSMLGLRENVVDVPYDMISSVRLDKGVFSSNVIFKAPGLISSGRRGTLDKMMEGYGDRSGLAEEEAIITAIPKDKAEELVEIIRNGIDRDREVYRHPQLEQSQQQSSLSIADELMKLANLKEKGIISEDEFQQMKQDLIKKKA